MDLKHHLRHPRVPGIWDRWMCHRTRGEQYTSGAAVVSWVEYVPASQSIQDTYAWAIEHIFTG